MSSHDVDTLDRKMPDCVNLPIEICREEFSQNAVFPSNMSILASNLVYGTNQAHPCVIAR